MQQFRVQTTQLLTTYQAAFDYICNPANLPQWTNAFESVSEGRAVLRTPAGVQEIQLSVQASFENGTIDWCLQFADGSQSVAYSRLVKMEEAGLAYIFLLTQPPVALDQLEGTLDQQSKILKEELNRLQNILNGKE